MFCIGWPLNSRKDCRKWTANNGEDSKTEGLCLRNGHILFGQNLSRGEKDRLEGRDIGVLVHRQL